MSSKRNALGFEAAMAELEALVERMERGDTSLEESLRDFKRGIELTRRCQRALSEAEQKVQILLEKDGAGTTEPFDSDDA
jgi:exodeoxyribonuclease VII small subunit